MKALSTIIPTPKEPGGGFIPLPPPKPPAPRAPPELLRLFAANGYTDLREIDGTYCALLPYLFTTGLAVGLNLEGHERRYCYEDELSARAALLAWDGSGHPSGPWIKCKGAGIDLLNPELQ